MPDITTEELRVTAAACRLMGGAHACAAADMERAADTIERLAARIAELDERLDATESACSDEESSHRDTLRSLEMRDVRIAELEVKVHACEVGKPYSSRTRDQSHASQIKYFSERCEKASVVFRCDCGFAMEGPYDPSDWPCCKCKSGKLIPEPLRRIAELEQKVAALQGHANWLKSVIDDVALAAHGWTAESRQAYVPAMLFQTVAALRADAERNASRSHVWKKH